MLSRNLYDAIVQPELNSSLIVHELKGFAVAMVRLYVCAAHNIR